jgi:hypothetical protein
MTTYYVESGHGGTNSGTSDNPWTTIDTAMNNVVAGDVVYVKASATYVETPNIDTAGTITNPITFIGYTSTITDEGKVTINSGSTNNLTGSTTQTYYIFANFIFTGATSHGVNLADEDSMLWVNCEFSSNSAHGILCDNNHTFVNCEAYSNSEHGFSCGTNARFIGCTSHSNTKSQFDAVSTIVAYKCVAYNPGNTASTYLFYMGSLSGGMLACTLDGDNASNIKGVQMTSEANPLVIDSVLYDIPTAVNVSASQGFDAVLAYNLINSNTTDYSTADWYACNFKDVTTAPAFTNEAGDDYTLDEASPALGTGLTPGGTT